MFHQMIDLLTVRTLSEVWMWLQSVRSRADFRWVLQISCKVTEFLGIGGSGMGGYIFSEKSAWWHNQSCLSV